MLKEEGTVRAQQMKTPYRRTSADISQSNKNKQDKDALNKFQYFLIGDDSQIEEAKTYFKSLYPNLEDIVISNDEVQFIYSDKRSPATIKRKGQTLSQFVQGVNYALSEKNQIVGVDNIKRSIKGYDPTDTYRDVGTAVYRDDKADRAIKAVADNFKVDTNNAVSSIQNFIASTDGLKGYTVEGPSNLGSMGIGSKTTIAVFDPDDNLLLSFDPENYTRMEEGIRELYMKNATSEDENNALKAAGAGQAAGTGKNKPNVG